MEFHSLQNSWNLWFHKSTDNNWTFDSYQKLASFDNLEDYAIISNALDEIHVENAMLFLMRKDIKPMWEADENINGGCLSFKIYKKSIYPSWNQLCDFLIGENILLGEDDWEKVNGISISPKKTFSILKIWFSDKNINDTKYLQKMDLFKYEDAIYKSHT